LNIETEKSLKHYNSFGFDISAEYFVSVESVTELHEAISWGNRKSVPTFILGGGSNIVFTRNVNGLVVHINIHGITTQTTADHVKINVGAGESWHGLVAATLKHKYFGLENLALIPGSAGAAPIQNIGAYGVEVAELLDTVEIYHRETGETFSLDNKDCQFGYRHSIFKTTAGSDYIVTAINLRLSEHDNPNISYRALEETLSASGHNSPNAQQVFDAVCAIRSAKLPDPQQIGNVGSFFKNPVINRQQLDALKTDHPQIPHYPDKHGHFKIPAAWLIDQAGWKGHQVDNVGVHNAQALVLVNHGDGNGQQIAILANNIKQDILRRYGVSLEREPTLY
jgi:UDP-N-acetylmuramate dehydrogenase